MIEFIEREVIWKGRLGGRTWFHPRMAMIPPGSASAAPLALMTLQEVTGDDVFGPVHESCSDDLGVSWTTPRKIPGMGRLDIGNGLQRGVCDVVPGYHGHTNTILAIGHDVYYRDDKLAIPGHLYLGPVYAVKNLDSGDWSKPQRPPIKDPRMKGICSPCCSQRLTLKDGTILLPCSWATKRILPRAVGTLLLDFDGHRFEIMGASQEELRHDVGRGLLEPSITEFSGRFYMTIRAEDGRGYVATSEDGMEWSRITPWVWEDGEPLCMSTTQQHWLRHGQGLHLVYTRRSKENVNVFRWRAPLYVAEVDEKALCLRRDTERVVFPLIGDGIERPEEVARMGNFHTVSATPEESWITVGETLPHNQWRGDTLFARVSWKQSNHYAPGP